MIRKIFSIVSFFISLVLVNNSFAIAPAKPGVQVPQYVIDKLQYESEKFMPRPALIYTMERYATAKQEAAKSGFDKEVDDIYGSFPVVCGKYSDSGADDWPVSEMQTQLFDGPWPTGTMAEFYEEISFNQFHLSGQVYGWYTSTLTQQYVVGYEQGFGPDAHLGEFFVELLDMADPTTDFSQYDNDGPDGVPNSGDDDGFVDSMFFIHDGPGGEIGANNIWSHSSNLYWQLGGNYYYTNDPSASGGYIKVGPYIVQPSINSSGNIIEIGVFCHEFGHALGLPDLYDTDYTSEGIGVWGLMSGGSWNSPAKPAHMISWSRYQLGWIQPIEVQNYLHDEMILSLNEEGRAYKLWTNGVYNNQYFMIENRRRMGFDINLRHEGLLLWHVDENAQQSNEDHPKVDMEEADGLDDLHNNTNSGDSGDPFPGTTDNRWFDEYTNPNSRNYFNQFTQVAIWNISDAADTMYANLDVIYSQPRFEFLNFTINDQTGNDDGRADPGETVDLWISIENQWANASSVSGYLTTESSQISILQGSTQFGAINSHSSGNNQPDPFEIEVSGNATNGAWVSFNIEITAQGGFSQELTFQMMIGRPPVLLVDDDGGEDYEQYIIESLESTPYLYEVWDVDQIGAPGDEAMAYDAIIWLTGDEDSNTLTSSDISSLEVFINSGGTFILTGQNINEDLGANPFYVEYLHSTPANNTVLYLTLDGVGGNPVSDGMSLLLVGTWGAGNQTSPSSVYPLSAEETLFSYPDGSVGGVFYHEPSSNAHVVYLTFGLEAVSGMGNTTSRDDLLNSIFDWAAVPNPVKKASQSKVPDKFVLNSIYPNPFNNSTEISFTIPHTAEFKVAVYNLLGKEVAVLGDGIFNSGENSLRWNASNVASGIYLVKIQGESVNITSKMVLLK